MPLLLGKRPLPLHVLDADDLTLDFAHRWWHARRVGGFLPSRAAVDTEMFRLLVDRAGWIDMRSPDAATWRLDPLAPLLRGLDADQAEEMVSGLRGDLLRIRFTGAVLLQDIAVAGRDRGGAYRLLALPHAEDGSHVLDLLVLVTWRAAGRDLAEDDPAAGSL